MNLIMLDIDGTLTQSYEYDQAVFGLAIGAVLGLPPVDADLTRYVDKTSTGVTQEAIRRSTGRNPGAGEIDEVKRRVLFHLGEMFHSTPYIFSQVPGAGRFLERLRKLEGAGIAIATGCWLSEALFKLRASGLDETGIPIASSDDAYIRQSIMQIAEEKARIFYKSQAFERVVYIGDGPWDLQVSARLGYGFIGIGPRLQASKDQESVLWHPDFLDLEAVLASVAKALEA
jgi:phosphoglycolate phosphatase-like HAD superfamily hydrolase